MSDDDSEEVEVQIPAYRLQAQDIIGIGLATLAGCLHQVAMGVQAVANEFYAAGNDRRQVEREIQERFDAAVAMGLIPGEASS